MSMNAEGLGKVSDLHVSAAGKKTPSCLMFLSGQREQVLRIQRRKIRPGGVFWAAVLSQALSSGEGSLLWWIGISCMSCLLLCSCSCLSLQGSSPMFWTFSELFSFCDTLLKLTSKTNECSKRPFLTSGCHTGQDWSCRKDRQCPHGPGWDEALQQTPGFRWVKRNVHLERWQKYRCWPNYIEYIYI